MAEWTHDSRALKILVVADEYFRECLVVARRLGSSDVLKTLAEFFVTHEGPAHIRSDNASEFTAELVRCGSKPWTSRRWSSGPAVRGRTAIWNRSMES